MHAGAVSVSGRALPARQGWGIHIRRKLQRAEAAVFAFAAEKRLPALKPLHSSSIYEEMHSFTHYSNWVIPECLMVGRYPYIEPGLNRRCDTHEKGVAQLENILGAGIRTFVCLQDELPDQHSMNESAIIGFHPYVSLCESLAGESIRTMHFPIEDLSVPKMEALNETLVEMEGRLVDGEKMYVHCWGGRGRAGLVTCCLLSKVFKISAEESLERIGRAFSTRQDKGYRSPQTAEQVQFVKQNFFLELVLECYTSDSYKEIISADFYTAQAFRRRSAQERMAEIEKVIERIQKNKGVLGLMVLDHQDTIVRSTFDEELSKKYQRLIPELSYSARHLVRDLDPQNDLEFYRIRSKEHEVMVAAYATFHLIVVQDPVLAQDNQ